MSRANCIVRASAVVGFLEFDELYVVAGQVLILSANTAYCRYFVRRGALPLP